MNLEEIISQRIQDVLTPPDPLPVFVAEIRYPHHAWYELDNPREMSPEELAQYLMTHFSLEQQARIMRELAKARREVDSPCGLRLVMLFQRDEDDRLILDDVRFMDPVDFTGFVMNSGRASDVQYNPMPQSTSRRQGQKLLPLTI